MNKKNIYLVGIKGVGMTALAIFLKEQGKNVWGSDVAESFPTDTVLIKHEIKVIKGFDESHISDDIELVITTGAHGGLNNVEVLTAKEKNIPVLTLAQAVGEIMNDFQTKISICGSHGKTTTTAMTGLVLNKLGMKSSYLVGAPSFSGLEGGQSKEVLAGGHFGGTDYFVVEADEYVSSRGVDNTPRFMYQNPDVIICTNIDYDHPDVFETIDAMEMAYLQFFKKLDAERGILIYCEENDRLRHLVAKVEVAQKYSYSLKDAESLQLLVPGRHNKLNAAAVLKFADVLNLNNEATKKILSSYSGSSRRFEKVFEQNGTILYDDYAHHPTEIEATIEAARSIYPTSRIVILFQPHMQSRTVALAKEFQEALQKADKMYLLDIFASARDEKEIITSKKLTEGTSIIFLTQDQIKARLGADIHKGDIIITAGAGDIYKIHYDIISIIKHVT